MTTEAAAKPLPEPTRDSKPYWDALNEGRLVLQQCAACKKIRVLSVERLFGEAIARIHRADSLSSLFV